MGLVHYLIEKLYKYMGDDFMNKKLDYYFTKGTEYYEQKDNSYKLSNPLFSKIPWKQILKILPRILSLVNSLTMSLEIDIYGM